MSSIAPGVRCVLGEELVALVAEHVDQRVADGDDVERRLTTRSLRTPPKVTGVDGRRRGDPVGLDRFGRRPQSPTLGVGAAVERGALLERTPERLDDGAELRLVELLAVAGAGGARDVLVHQRAAEVVAPGLQRLPRAAARRS